MYLDERDFTFYPGPRELGSPRKRRQETDVPCATKFSNLTY